MSKLPQVLYHYTSEINLGSIVHSGMLTLTDNNLFVSESNGHEVVWMTSSVTTENHGLKFADHLPAELDKTRYRFTIRMQPHFKRWIDWCDELGIPEEARQSLILSANAEETHRTWYVSEQTVGKECWLSIDNIATGKHLWDCNHL